MSVIHGGNIFEVARERGWDWRDVADFSASINPLGPSPAVFDAIRAALDRIQHYPERDPGTYSGGPWRNSGTSTQRRSCWATAPPSFSTGSRASSPQPVVTLATPVFSEFYRAYPDGPLRVARTSPAGGRREGLLVLTQPNNPTGAALPSDALEQWLLRTDNPVLLDESFLDFTGLPSAARLLERRPQLWILRSLTKFYALPGLRIGALLASAGGTRR